MARLLVGSNPFGWTTDIALRTLPPWPPSLGEAAIMLLTPELMSPLVPSRAGGSVPSCVFPQASVLQRSLLLK